MKRKTKPADGKGVGSISLVSRVRIEGHDGYLINTKSGTFFQRSNVRNALDTPMAPHEYILIDLCEELLKANDQ